MTTELDLPDGWSDTTLELDYCVPHRLSIDVPHLSDYFGIWAAYEPAFRAIVERCNGLNLHAHIQSSEAKQVAAAQLAGEYPVTKDGIAIFRVEGPMMKRASSLSGGTSTTRLRQQLRSAQRDPEVVGALLVMDTPGGTAKGNRDLADAVAAFARAKPIYAFVEDMTASAGVSVASQATARFANNATALYGSMGTYAVIVDQSGLAEKLGVKVHVVRAGEFKGAGEPGAEVTESQLAELQRVVNRLNNGYLELIARGLNKPLAAIREVADGRIIMAADAAAMGLIDGVQTQDETYRQLVAAVQTTPQRRTSAMTQETTAPAAATLAELKKSFPGSTAEWRESQLEAGATLSEAAMNFASFVQDRAAAEKAELQKQLDEAKAAKPGGSLGHSPLKQAEGDDDYLESGDAVEDFHAAVAQIAGPSPTLQQRQAAIRRVASKRPGLYQAYLLAGNPGSRQQRMIREKLEPLTTK